MSNVGKWDAHYASMPYIIPMGLSDSYEVAAKAFRDAGVTEVEDWGCGYGWMETVLGTVAPGIRYVGVDGSRSPYHDRVIDDLTTRQTKVEGIFMRHVLEHNYDWPTILDNALASFTKLFVLVLFTPDIVLNGTDDDRPHEELQFEEEFGVPTLALNQNLIEKSFNRHGLQWEDDYIVSPYTSYGHEDIFVVSR